MACNCDDKTGASSVPYIVYEEEQARNERHIKRLISTLIIAVGLLFLSNAAWLFAWCQYDYSAETEETTTIKVDGGDGGDANYIGNDGDIYNGADNSNQNESDA